MSERWVVPSTLKWLDTLLTSLAPDVINVHNLHWASRLGWSPRLLELCLKYAPTVWTLHDMWSFTGRCAYSYDCRKFISGCDTSCPTPGEYPQLEPELIAGAWEARRRLFSTHTDLVAVCPSHWMAREARAGFWNGHRVEVIPNGLPLDVYQPLDRSLARASLGIDTSVPALLVAADNLTVRRKGASILVEALRKIRSRPIALITLGHGRLPIAVEGITLCYLGYIGDERTKVLAYNAADLLVHPAPVDNLPNVVVEALACGTPCVGFSVGGVPDLVRPGLTGWLAQDVDAQLLANVIDDALTAIKQGVDLRPSCRAIVEKEYDSLTQIQRYLCLLESVRRDL